MGLIVSLVIWGSCFGVRRTILSVSTESPVELDRL